MDAQSVIDELNFKVATAVIGICEDEKRGIITRAQALTALQGIFNAVSGLISQDNFDFLSAASEEYKGAKGMEATFLKEDGHIVGTIRLCGSGALLQFGQGQPIRLPQDNSEREVDAEAKAEQAEWHRVKLAALQKAKERGSW